MRKILVVGFSVTAEPGGFVEVASSSGWPNGVEVQKVGIGGVHPFHLQYIMPSILRNYAPDYVILEIATSGMRTVHNPKPKHQAAVQSILSTCQEYSKPVAFLDLSRKDIHPQTDWAMEEHRMICESQKLPYRRVTEVGPEYVHDLVHPTPKGKRLYAQALQEVVKQVLETQRIPSIEPMPVSHDAIVLVLDKTKPTDIREFDRSGYEVEFRILKEEEEITVALPEGTSVAGLTFIRGPKSGKIRISTQEHLDLQTYDPHCYYERFGMALFNKISGTNISIRQLPTIPDTELKKGDKDLGPRIGFLGHLLIEKAPSGEKKTHNKGQGY